MRYRQLDRRHLCRGRQTGGHREPCSAGCPPIMACQSPSIAFVPNWAVAISSQAAEQCGTAAQEPLAFSRPAVALALPAQAPPAIMPKQPAASSPPFPLFSSLPFPLHFSLLPLSTLASSASPNKSEPPETKAKSCVGAPHSVQGVHPLPASPLHSSDYPLFLPLSSPRLSLGLPE